MRSAASRGWGAGWVAAVAGNRWSGAGESAKEESTVRAAINAPRCLSPLLDPSPRRQVIGALGTAQSAVCGHLEGRGVMPTWPSGLPASSCGLRSVASVTQPLPGNSGVTLNRARDCIEVILLRHPPVMGVKTARIRGVLRLFMGTNDRSNRCIGVLGGVTVLVFKKSVHAGASAVGGWSRCAVLVCRLADAGPPAARRRPARRALHASAVRP